MEVLISISVVAVIALTALAALRFGLGVWESGDRAAEEAFMKRYLSGEMRKALASAYPYRDEDGNILFLGAPESLAFVTSGRTASPDVSWGGAMLLRYSVSGEGLLLEETTLPLADGAGKRSVVAGAAAALEFAYFGDGAWRNDWDAALMKKLPEMVRVTLSGNTGDPVSFETALMAGKGSGAGD
ncbi:MAG: hypothetical protein H3C68_03735 [Deltaproteobacteria bacterium]|nr:hypothetical protein [Deltaproteobacteria bacterium]MBZ0219835.1 type II secretion system protein GspJ [Deltaproteobacteria bacterium]